VRVYVAVFLTSTLCLAGVCAGQDANPVPGPAQASTVIRAEKKLVLVDAVVTDKHGNYIHDLTAEDFRLWEDKKEQKIETFSFEADPKSPLVNQKHYLVLFFDNSDTALTDQMQARKAALRFIDANAGPNRMMAVVNFGGSLQVTQNFTADTDRLKQVVSGVRFATSPTELAALAGSGPLGRAAFDFGARDVLLALRSLAKGLATVPGRKTLIFLSPGFPLPLTDSILHSELTAVFDACNKANVAIYPIDVKGLSMSAVSPIEKSPQRWNAPVFIQAAVYRRTPVVYEPAAYEPQRGGSAGGGAATGGGGHAGGPTSGGAGSHSIPSGGAGSHGAPSGGSPSGGTAGTGARAGSGYNYGTGYNYVQPRSIWPHMNSVTDRQDLLRLLAEGTGGFVILNTNDLVGGLNKIGNEQNEYYILGYSPSEDPEEGSCHTLKVKVDRGGTEVRARTGYCTEKPLDLLAGSPAEKTLEARVFNSAPGNVKASMEAPFFYTGPNTARVSVAMEISPDSLKFQKQKGKMHSEVSVLGVAYGPDGSIAAKFSDTIKLDLDGKKEVKDFAEHPMHYEKQFDIASGNYLFKVAFTCAGESFGKLQMPLIVEPYDSKKFGVSALALSDRFDRLTDIQAGLDAELLEDVKPLVSQGVQLTPSGSNVFKKGAATGMYLEIYEPLLADQSQAAPPKIGLQVRVLDPKTGQAKVDTGFMNVANYSKLGSPVVPIGLKLPIDNLTPGSYRVEAKAIDAAGNASIARTADFVLE